MKIWGYLIAIVFWMLLYGCNPLIRWWLLRRHHARYEVIEQMKVTYQPLRYKRARLLFYPVGLTMLAGYVVSDDFAKGVLLATGMLAVLWPFYVRTRTCTELLLLFDRQGLTVFPLRRGMVGAGTFQTRLNWVDCFGYSIYKGHLLFALRAGGQVEQAIKYRPQVVETLHRLGVRKLKSYDLLELHDLEPDALQLLERRVHELAQDIVSGYQAEAAAIGLYLQADVQYADDSEQQNEPYAFLKMSLWQEEQMVDELDWLLWARYETYYEFLHLPEERLYEALDERVLSLIEAQPREQGRHTPPALLQ